MKDYDVIARTIGLKMIKQRAEQGFSYLSNFVHWLKTQKKSPALIRTITRVKILLEEGCSEEVILQEIGILDPKIIGSNLLEGWYYPESLDPKEIRKGILELTKKFEGELTTEELLFYLFVNHLEALRQKMIK